MNSSIAPLSEADSSSREPPPSNIEAEQALLGAIFINNRAYHNVAGFLRAEHFWVAAHARIYAETAALIERGLVANPVTLKAKFDHAGALKNIGGSQYLARLAASAVTVLNAYDYGRAIVEAARQRELIVLLQEGI